MRILALETTGPKASVAFLDTERNIADERVAAEEMSHLQASLPLAKTMLAENGLSINDMTHIAVSRGPGSFTGIRIGMTEARTLAQVLDVPVIPVPTLESFLYHAEDENTLVCPVFDAKRSQVYGAAYRMEGGKRIIAVPEQAYDIQDYMSLVQIELYNTYVDRSRSNPQGGLLQMKPVFFGDGIEPYKKTILEKLLSWCDQDMVPDGFQALAAPEIRFQTALPVAFLGAMMAEEGKAVSWKDAEPVYLRKSEAERKLDAEKQGKLSEAKDIFTK